MDDHAGTAFCEGCADDAAECGLFFGADDCHNNHSASGGRNAMIGELIRLTDNLRAEGGAPCITTYEVGKGVCNAHGASEMIGVGWVAVSRILSGPGDHVANLAAAQFAIDSAKNEMARMARLEQAGGTPLDWRHRQVADPAPRLAIVAILEANDEYHAAAVLARA